MTYFCNCNLIGSDELQHANSPLTIKSYPVKRDRRGVAVIFEIVSCDGLSLRIGSEQDSSKLPFLGFFGSDAMVNCNMLALE